MLPLPISQIEKAHSKYTNNILNEQKLLKPFSRMVGTQKKSSKKKFKSYCMLTYKLPRGQNCINFK